MVIEKGIPVPVKGSRGGKWTETAKNMEPGDSVLCDNADDKAALLGAMRRRGIRTTCRKLREGYRVWRLK